MFGIPGEHRWRGIEGVGGGGRGSTDIKGHNAEVEKE
jgi:hypothetical protein